MSSIFRFGDTLDGYPVPVLNERAVRAAAGILFATALASFMSAILMGNFRATRVFVVAFLIDFCIRLFVNPRFAPSMILGQWAVRSQQPEWVGAPQKRFAWGIGLVLALAMFYLMIYKNTVGPINALVCGICLLLMFFETAFGICVGCRIYNAFNKDKAQLCPGGVCELPPAQRPAWGLPQMGVVLAFGALMLTVAPRVAGSGPMLVTAHQGQTAASPDDTDPAEVERCKVPDFAKAMGHEAKWKEHNHCR
ncbi:MAG: DUF4395 domain-containing protein [Rubrivivax sp.]|nr:DUF4395 domain-containing protein [Rubrivivax sp.]